MANHRVVKHERIHMRMTTKLKKRILKDCKRHDINMTQWIERAAWEYLDRVDAAASAEVR